MNVFIQESIGGAVLGAQSNEPPEPIICRVIVIGNEAVLKTAVREIGIWVRVPGSAFNGVVTLIGKGVVC